MTGKFFGLRDLRRGEHEAFAWDRVAVLGLTVAFWLAVAVLLRAAFAS
jgi:hypothetical protein